MKYYIIVAESAFEKLPKDSIGATAEITLLVDNAIEIPTTINDLFAVIPLQTAEPIGDRKSCSVFTEEFQKSRNFKRYSTDIEPHINGIYEYVISSINDILFTIESVYENSDEIFLIGGNQRLKIAACYAVKSPEFNKNVFFDRADVLNPFLYEALRQQNKNVTFCESLFIISIVKYIARVTLLFSYSTISTIIKYISRCFKTNDHTTFKDEKNTFEYIIFPVRSQPQLDFAESVAKKMITSDSRVKPIVFYYEMVSGKSFFHRVVGGNYAFSTLYKFRYLWTALVSIVFLIWNSFRCFFFLKREEPLRIYYENYQYELPLFFLAFENFASPHLFIYEALLEKNISSFNNLNIIGICSTEMIGQQAFIERAVSKRNSLVVNNIQTSVVYEQYYPVKSVADHTLCLSLAYAKNFNETGISNKGTALFIGALKYLSTAPKTSNFSEDLTSILYATQPYEPQVTLEFLKQLSCWLNTNMKLVTLRLRVHPRDDKSNYKSLDNIDIVSETETISDSIQGASLILTRTSSVVLDAIDNKVPYLICKLSNFDLKVDLPYLTISDLTVFNCNELLVKLVGFKEFSKLYKETIIKQISKEGEVPQTSDETVRLFLKLYQGKGTTFE